MSESSTATPPPALSKGQVFLRRLSSTLALWGLVAVTLWSGKSLLFFALVGGLGVLGLIEYTAMDRSVPAVWRRMLLWCGIAYFGVTFTLAHRGSGEWSHAVDTAFLAGFALLAFVPALFRPLEGRDTLWAICYSIAGFVYVPFLWGFMMRLLFLPDTPGGPGMDADSVVRGMPYALFVIAATKLTDSGAYAVGSLIGKHKMIPHISPGKSWEGLIGAVLGALLGGMLVWWGFRDRMPLISCAGVAAGISVLLGAVCIVGDLAESIIKRCLGIKDSGKMLPGIGGSLDLIDSLLYTAPVFYFCTYVLGR